MTCNTCIYKEMPPKAKEAWCYMFWREPTGYCVQYSAKAESRSIARRKIVQLGGSLDDLQEQIHSKEND